MKQLTAHFNEGEGFCCPCCGQCKMNPGFMQALEQFRVAWGKPFSPVEGGGYRCEIYDGKKGAHTEGKAIDPGIAREDMYEFISLAFLHGFQGIGLKQKGGHWQVHLDMAEAKLPERPRPWLWTY